MFFGFRKSTWRLLKSKRDCMAADLDRIPARKGKEFLLQSVSCCDQRKLLRDVQRHRVGRAWNGKPSRKCEGSLPRRAAQPAAPKSRGNAWSKRSGRQICFY